MAPVAGYEVAVAVIGLPVVAGVDADALPSGYEEAFGARGRHATETRSRIAAVGDEAVRVATEELARQVGVTARRFAEVLDNEPVSDPAPGDFGVESVQVTFGVTLSGGVQALFTAQAESSAQVTLTLSRRPRA